MAATRRREVCVTRSVLYQPRCCVQGIQNPSCAALVSSPHPWKPATPASPSVPHPPVLPGPSTVASAPTASHRPRTAPIRTRRGRPSSRGSPETVAGYAAHATPTAPPAARGPAGFGRAPRRPPQPRETPRAHWPPAAADLPSPAAWRCLGRGPRAWYRRRPPPRGPRRGCSAAAGLQARRVASQGRGRPSRRRQCPPGGRGEERRGWRRYALPQEHSAAWTVLWRAGALTCDPVRRPESKRPWARVWMRRSASATALR